MSTLNNKLNVTKEIVALQRLGMNDLRAVYAKVHGEASRSGNREFLIKRIIWRMQSNAEGSLSERALERARELADESYLRTTIPSLPPVDPGARQLILDTTPQMKAAAGVQLPGTIITRPYKGRTIQVRVLDDGFEYEGDRYGSLSAVAKKVTGSHCSGHAFFGIAKHGGRS